MLWKYLVCKVILHFCASTHCFQDIGISNFVPCKVGQCRRVQLSKGILCCKIYKSVKVARCIFTPALAVSEILTFTICNLQKVGCGHRVQFSQWCLSMSNINIYKSRLTQFCASCYRFTYINVSNVWPSKSRSRLPNTIFAMTPFDWKCQNKKNSHYFVSSYRFWYIKFFYFWS